MTKQESIKKAYGDYYEKCNPNENGWIDYDIWFKNIGHKIDYDYSGNQMFMRPKCLSGIENNNGWVKMNNKRDNLPTEHCKCWLWTKDGIMFGDYNSTTQGFYGYKEIKFTHYQIISEPKPPIY